MRKSVYAGKNLFQLEKIFSSREKQVFVVPVLNLSNMSMREKESKRKKYFPIEKNSTSVEIQQHVHEGKTVQEEKIFSSRKNIVVPVLKFSNMSMRKKQSRTQSNASLCRCA